MTDEVSRKPFPLFTVSVLTVIGLLVFYILSPAPVVFLIVKVCPWIGVALDMPLAFVRYFYMPIAAVADRSPLVSDFYTWQFRALGL